MLSNREIQALSEDIIQLYIAIEDDLLLNVAKRFSINDEITPDTVAEWQAKKLEQLGALRKSNINTLARRSKLTYKQIKKILTDAGFKALNLDEEIYKKAFSSGLLVDMPVPAKLSPMLKQVIEGAIDNTRKYFNLINTTALESAQQGFLDIINQTYLETSLGITDYNTSVRKAVRNLADKGITGATYKSAKGRITRNHIDVAVRRCIVTSTSQTAGKMQIQRAEEWGSNLVEVTSHMGARPDHAKWQGKIYSLEGDTEKYPNLVRVTGYGSVTGLKGVNCDHDFYPFFEGISEQTYFPFNEKENKKVYEESQEQRKLERSVRKQKRRILAAEQIGDKEGLVKAQLKLKDKESRLKEHVKSTGRTQRTNRQQVVGFGHSEASKAVWTKKKEIQKYSKSQLESVDSYGKKLINSNKSSIINNKDIDRFDKKEDADKLLRKRTENLWNKLSPLEKESAFEYTKGSGSFNRPLRGYDKTWNNFVGVGKVPINNEGAEKWIKGLESAIDKSKISNDIWLFRGSDKQSLAGLLDIDKSKLIPSNIKTLNNKFAGKLVNDNAFFSTGIAADAGFKDIISYEILVPKGTKGIYAEPFSRFGGTNDTGNWDGKEQAKFISGEAEIILQKGVTFEIVDIKEVSAKINVVLRVIN